MDFNQNSKRKIFGLIPYSSIRFATSYCFIYPDTPFGNQNIYKSNSLRNIVNLANIKVNKKIVLPEWHSRNKSTGGAYISNNMGSTTKTNTKTTSKCNNNNFKKIKMYFNKTIISSWSPKKVTKKQSYNNINTDLIIKENKRKIKDLHNKIAKVMLPNEKFEKKNPIKICKMVAEIRAKSQKKKVNKLNETQKSIFSEQQSMDMNDFFDYNNLNDKFFSMLNFNQQIQDSLIPIYDMDINNKTTLNKEEIKEIIQVFFNIQNIYTENYLNLFNKNKLFKKKYSDIIYRLDLIDDILKEYKLIQNNLSYKNDSKALTELRDQNLESIEKSLLRELRLIKYFRLQYDYEEHKNNEKKLLKDIIMKITQSDKFTKLSEDKRKNIVRLFNKNIISFLYVV